MDLCRWRSPPAPDVFVGGDGIDCKWFKNTPVKPPRVSPPHLWGTEKARNNPCGHGRFKVRAAPQEESSDADGCLPDHLTGQTVKTGAPHSKSVCKWPDSTPSLRSGQWQEVVRSPLSWEEVVPLTRKVFSGIPRRDLNFDPTNKLRRRASLAGGSCLGCLLLVCFSRSSVSPTRLCRAATTRDTRWWWTRWSTIFTSFPAASSTPRSPPSSVRSTRAASDYGWTATFPHCFHGESIQNPFKLLGEREERQAHLGQLTLFFFSCRGLVYHTLVIFLVSCFCAFVPPTERLHRLGVVAVTQLWLEILIYKKNKCKRIFLLFFMHHHSLQRGHWTCVWTLLSVCFYLMFLRDYYSISC